MKTTAVSGDLMVKLALGAVLLVGGFVVLRKVSAGASDAAAKVVDAVNPASSNNIVNRAVTAVGDAIVSPTGPGRNADGSWTLGGWLYDITHDDPMATTPRPGTGPVQDVAFADPYDRHLKNYQKPANIAGNQVTSPSGLNDVFDARGTGFDF